MSIDSTRRRANKLSIWLAGITPFTLLLETDVIFDTTVAGIPCQCEVVHAYEFIPMRSYGPGMEDATEAEGFEFEFNILDRKGYKAKWLEKKVTPADIYRLYEEFTIMQEGLEYA